MGGRRAPSGEPGFYFEQGLRLRRVRLNLLMSEKGFCAAFGFRSKRHLLKVEAGRARLTIHHVRLIRRHTNVRWSWLCVGEGEMCEDRRPSESRWLRQFRDDFDRETT